jgi:predicted alpha/beta-fold hydrolase
MTAFERQASIDGMKEFEPHPWLRNAHLMTIAGVFWRRKFPRLPTGAPRLFDIESETQSRADCHWQKNPREHATLVLVHGLEGSSESGYILGTAEKAFVAGFNVVRLNQRNCGGTEHLTPDLYHSGRSADVRTVIEELIELDKLPEIFAAGFSMGGNLVLKMAGEYAGAAPEQVRGFVGVAPSFVLAACADALEERRNFIYERYFVRRLKQRMRRKAELFPERYAARVGNGALRAIGSVREFDEMITAPCSGFAGAEDYYAQASAINVLGAIARPTLILTAMDDPFVPYATFERREVRENPNIRLVATEHGGHCAFIGRESGEERFWCEGRIVEFCSQNLAMAERNASDSQAKGKIQKSAPFATTPTLKTALGTPDNNAKDAAPGTPKADPSLRSG